MLQMAATIKFREVGFWEHTRLACDRPASSPDGFRNEAGALAAVLFAMIRAASFYVSFHLRSGNRRLCPARTPGTTPGDGCAPRNFSAGERERSETIGSKRNPLTSGRRSLGEGDWPPKLPAKETSSIAERQRRGFIFSLAQRARRLFRI